MLRKCLPLLLGALMVLTGSSCFNILETIRLNKDGSGTYTVDMDLGDALQMIMQFAGAFDTAMAGESDRAMVDAMSTGMDSTLYFTDAPDSIQDQWTHPQITRKASLNMRIEPQTEAMVLSFALPFESPQQIDLFGEDLSKTGDMGFMNAFTGGGAAESGDEGAVVLTAPEQFGFSKGILTRQAVDGATMFGGQSGDEDIDMMKLFLGGATYTVRYELEGKVKKVEAADFQQPDKHTVVMERDLIDLLDNKTDLAVEIRFK